MLPTKLPSSRRGNPSAVRRSTFGTDAGLVALRYEKTVQAEPPIPFVSRSSIRSSRRPSSSSTSSHHSHHPIVVAPPSAVPPPAEEHPAFRTVTPPSSTLRASPVIVEQWKRDSGVARTNSTSTSTIHEEDDEEECQNKSVYSRVRKGKNSTTLVMSPVLINDSFADENSISAALTSVSSNSSIVSNVRCDTPPPKSHSPAATRSPSPLLKSVSLEETPEPPKTFGTPSQSPSATPLSSPSSSPRSSFSSSPRRLIKSISSRSGSTFKTPSLKALAPMHPLWWGSESHPPTEEPEGSGAPILNIPGIPASSSPVSAIETAPTPVTAAVATTKPKLTKHKQKSTPSSSPKSVSRFWHRRDSSSTSTATSSSDLQPFVPLDVSIPCESLLDDDYFLSSIHFSKRGSIMLSGHDVATINGKTPNPESNQTAIDDVERRAPTPTTPPAQSRAPHINDTTEIIADSKKNKKKNKKNTTVAEAPQSMMSPPDIRVLAADVEKESQKVRSLYTVGDGPYGESGVRHSYCERLDPTPEAPLEENDNVPAPESLAPAPAFGGSSSLHYELPKSQHEYNDGLEDWNDLEGARVDRYGFITLPPPPGPRAGIPSEVRSLPGSPRKKRSILVRRDAAGLSVHYGGRRTPTRKMSARSLNTQASELSASPSLRSTRSVIRQASNLLPHNRDRRWMDEAGEMLNTSPSLQDIVEEAKASRLNDVMKRKEWERSEKWRKMAKVVCKSGRGQGMEFEFNVENPKLIERTWKGIPDRWRAAAWWSFLATSAKERKDSASEEEIIAEFHKLQLRSSPDDVQIDLDVPRTISRHIMFRRRYRGGQRLMFRVLHAISIYFPETGYVQGMASLVATLLCYFDEEKCFVMLVRMWQYRGLCRLYRPGFDELITAMKDFHDNWLNKEVAKKLEELCIDITAYGTRWYLTLFNLSIPFAAQLRVWDVFLLLGNHPSPASESSSEPGKSEAKDQSRRGEYDVLHATSAALAEALREALSDSDFENAMKVLTAPIQIKDEDLLLKVMKAEWKTHHSKKKA
ncbi:rab-GTPase-TBC domain-containing protein [Mariannaea sp. PMI_226]|nr:rab-GTPase-TBC domain-containing protein [Mariannaea sp. PMI_226]